MLGHVYSQKQASVNSNHIKYQRQKFALKQFLVVVLPNKVCCQDPYFIFSFWENSRKSEKPKIKRLLS